MCPDRWEKSTTDSTQSAQDARTRFSPLPNYGQGAVESLREWTCFEMWTETLVCCSGWRLGEWRRGCTTGCLRLAVHTGGRTRLNESDWQRQRRRRSSLWMRSERSRSCTRPHIWYKAPNSRARVFKYTIGQPLATDCKQPPTSPKLRLTLTRLTRRSRTKPGGRVEEPAWTSGPLYGIPERSVWLYAGRVGARPSAHYSDTVD
jgi:hypothetical protein